MTHHHLRFQLLGCFQRDVDHDQQAGGAQREIEPGDLEERRHRRDEGQKDGAEERDAV